MADARTLFSSFPSSGPSGHAFPGLLPFGQGAARHLLRGLKAKDLALETPAIANYTTGEVMGVSSDRLSAKFGVSRSDQDAFAVRSHALAGKAHADG